MEHLTLEVYDSFDQSQVNLQEWRELLKHCVLPSIFMTPEFMLPALEHLVSDKRKAKTLVVRKQSKNKLVALFFFENTYKKWKSLQFNMIQYAVSDEIDKPYPIIHTQYESQAWKLVMNHFQSYRKEWDILNLMELPRNSVVFQQTSHIFKLPSFFTINSIDNSGPIVDLQQSWNNFFNTHRNMRKKIRKMSKDFGKTFEFRTYTKENAPKGLDEYIRVEQKSWKVEKLIGVSKSPRNIAFYRQLITELAKINSVYFGFIYIDGEPITAEMAFSYGENIYFPHGTYDSKYQKYSPGTVSTALFIKSFCGQSYKSGDFFAGYASYINPWSKEIIETKRLTILKLTPRIISILILVGIKKYYRNILKKVCII